MRLPNFNWKNPNLIKLGSGILVLQNLSILFLFVLIAGNIASGETFAQGNLILLIALFTIFLFDLIGFSLFAAGLIQTSEKDGKRQKSRIISATAIVAWVASRIIIQYNVIFWGIDENKPLEFFIFIYAINSLFLLVSGIFVDYRRFQYYCALNFFAIWLLVLGWAFSIPGLLIEISVFVKIITVPVVGIYTFREIYNNSWLLVKDHGLVVETYPEYR